MTPEQGARGRSGAGRSEVAKRGEVSARPGRRRAASLARTDLEAILSQIDAAQSRISRARGSRGARSDAVELDRLRHVLIDAIAGDTESDDDGDDLDTHGDADVWDRALDGDWSDEVDWGDDDLGVDDGTGTDDTDTDDTGTDDWDVHGSWSRGGWRRFPPARPREVAGGIATRSRRGTIGDSWWSRRFLSAIEAAMAGGRSTRGRTYARKGQVIELSIGPGVITAKVQGTRRTPYTVRIAMPVADDEQWEKVVSALASQAVHAAQLLAGELPPEVETVFAGEGVTLLPSPTSRLATDCTCPDWANPCKHVAAVCYLVAEAIDRDPFQLLAWRGRDRDTLLERLRELRGGTDTSLPIEDLETVEEESAPPLVECVLGFWKAGPELADIHFHPVPHEMPGAVLRQVQRGTLTVRSVDIADVLDPLYRDVVEAAGQRAAGAEPARLPVSGRSKTAPSSRGSRTGRATEGG